MTLEDKFQTVFLGNEQMFNFFKRNNNSDKTNIGRRNFMKGVVGLTGAAMVAPGLLIPETAEAATSKYPPGIARSSMAVRYAWGAIEQGKNNFIYNFLLPGTKVYNNTQISKRDMKNDPAVYFCLAYKGGDNTYPKAMDKRFGGLDEKDPMVEFAKGIGHYNQRWIQSRESFDGTEYTPEVMERVIEIPLLKSIFGAANPNIVNARISQYQSDRVDKDRLLQNVMEDLKKAGEREQVIANWANTWLINHYDIINKVYNDTTAKGNSDKLYSIIEKPLRNKVGKIRGPAYYYNNSI